MRAIRAGLAIAIVAAGLAVPPLAHAQSAESSTSNSFHLSPTGYAQLDFHGFPGWSEAPGTGDLNRKRLELRRLRVGVDGRWRRLSWEFSVEPLEGDEFLKDAHLDFRVRRSLRVRGGHFKLPGSREYLISARQLDFLERTALAASLAAGRDAGVMIIGKVGRRVDYRGGLFAGDGSTRGSRAKTTIAGRMVWEPAKGLEIGGSWTEGHVRSGAVGEQNGLDGRAPSGYRFFDELYTQGQRVRVGFDVAWDRGPWRFSAEALRARDERLRQGSDQQDLPAIVGAGWSASLVRRFGTDKRVREGQWQIGARYDYLAFDDEGPDDAGTDSTRSRAPNVRARAAHTVLAGASWKVTRWMRVLSNAGVERYPEVRSAPDADQRTYLTAAARLQFELP